MYNCYPVVMDEKLLMSLGLSQNIARTYRILAARKSLRPGELMKLNGESRTNCYALLDKLVTLELAYKQDVDKKLTYYPASPIALKKMLDVQRQKTEEQLQVLDTKLPKLLESFHSGGEQPKVNYFRGKKELEQMYINQLEENSRNLYFIRSKADVSYFGLSKMEEIRYLAPKYGKRRYGVTPIVSYSIGDQYLKDSKAGGLKRAWISGEEYSSKVEWAVSGDTVQAILLDGEGYGISITHPEIAESFVQIMQLLHDYIRKSPIHQQRHKNALDQIY